MASVDQLSHIVATVKVMQTIRDAKATLKLAKAQMVSAMADPRTPNCRVKGGKFLSAVAAPYTPGYSQSAIDTDLDAIRSDAEAQLAEASKASKADKPQAVAA